MVQGTLIGAFTDLPSLAERVTTKEGCVLGRAVQGLHQAGSDHSRLQDVELAIALEDDADDREVAGLCRRYKVGLSGRVRFCGTDTAGSC